MIRVHVGKASSLVVATDEDVVEGAWFVLHNLGAHCGRKSCERIDEIVVVPNVAVFAVGIVDGEAVATRDRHRHLVAFNAGAAVAVLLRESGRPQIGGFDDVIIDRDDARDFHGGLLSVSRHVPRI